MSALYAGVIVIVMSLLWFMLQSMIIGPEVNVAARKDAAEKKFFADTQEIQKSTAPNKVALVQQLQEKYARDITQIQADVSAHARNKIMYPGIAFIIIGASGVFAYKYLPWSKSYEVV